MRRLEPIPSWGSSSGRRSGTTRSATRRRRSRSPAAAREHPPHARHLLAGDSARRSSPARVEIPTSAHDRCRSGPDHRRAPHRARRAGPRRCCAAGGSSVRRRAARRGAYGVGQVEVEERPEPDARPGWVVVRVESASLCGTDSHQYDGRVDTPFPSVPGHDFSGRVESVGEGVDEASSARRWRSSRRCRAGTAGVPRGQAARLPEEEAHGPVVGRVHDREGRRAAGQPVPRPEVSRRGRRRCWSRSRWGSTPSTGCRSCSARR